MTSILFNRQQFSPRHQKSSRRNQKHQMVPYDDGSLQLKRTTILKNQASLAWLRLAGCKAQSEGVELFVRLYGELTLFLIGKRSLVIQIQNAE